MNIPLDRLYYYIRDIAQEIYGDRIIIYRFWPNGSKNINNLNHLNEGKYESLGPDDWYKRMVSPLVWCNDQEPLDYDYYAKNLVQPADTWAQLIKSIDMVYPVKNLNYSNNLFEKNLLLHSEKRSKNLKLYKQGSELIPVYYWSHALIARDWFRYAEHNILQKDIKKTFLIYNRAWSGTREYRLKFSELIIRAGLEQYCQMNINPIEPEIGIHYNQHKFNNPIWRPTQVIENYFPINNVPSHYSADFDTADYNSTDIEVVLETLFDDSRLHLTEKSLRPIACTQPFILAGTHGSLEYLRSYGFKTFGHLWDEQYDQIEDPSERLIAITNLMQQIANWTPEERANKMLQAHIIADYNKKYFFSQEFFNTIVNELKINLEEAFKEQESGNNYIKWADRWKALLANNDVIKFLNTNKNHKLPTKEQVDRILNFAKQRLL
jgi:hypothetical protein